MKLEFFQVVISIWLNAHHPFTHTFPKIYYPTDIDQCLEDADKLAQRWKKPKIKFEIGCAPTLLRGKI